MEGRPPSWSLNDGLDLARRLSFEAPFGNAGQHAGTEWQHRIIQGEAWIVQRDAGAVSDREIGAGNRTQHVGEVLAFHTCLLRYRDLVLADDITCDVDKVERQFFIIRENFEDLADIHRDLDAEGRR